MGKILNGPWARPSSRRSSSDERVPEPTWVGPDAEELKRRALNRRARRARFALAAWAAVAFYIGWWPLAVWFLGVAIFARRILRRKYQ